VDCEHNEKLASDRKKNKFYFHIKDLEDISLRELIFVVSKIPCGNTSEISDLTDILFTGFYNDNPWALFNKLMPIYLEHSRLLEVEERSGNVYLFTHAPTTYTYCLNMLKEQGLQNNGIQVFYDLYNFYLQKQDAFLGFFEKVEDVPQSYIHGMELAMPNRSLAFNFVWNRSFDLNYPAEENIKFINIIGHVGKNEELSSDQRLIFRTRKVVNLDDSYLGKEDFSVTDSNLPRADNIPFFALYQN